MIKSFKEFLIFEGKKQKPRKIDALMYVYNPKNDKLMGFNLILHSDEFNNILYDVNGKGQGYGWGPQIDDNGNGLVFDKIEDAQNWHTRREEKTIMKGTQNKKYPVLSKIALQLRKMEDFNFRIINRGSCFRFAKEISKLGYNDFTFIFSEEEQEIIHVYVKLTNNLYWDALGFHTKKDIKIDYDIGKDNLMFDAGIDELNNYCDIDTYQSLTTIPISDNIWKRILNIIRNSKSSKDG